MRRIIKPISFFLTLLLTVSVLTACGGERENTDNKLNILCTVFPIYDWAREISADKAETTLLLSNGTDMHSFQPSAADMIKIAECDVLIYVGGESDKWIDTAVEQYKNESRVCIKLLELLGDKAHTEEHTEGMEEHGGEAEEAEYDEHVWLSLKNAELFSANIAEALSEIDPDNSAAYEKNAESYVQKLKGLGSDYQNAVEASRLKTILVADRFPFRYLTEDYSLEYFAAFPGCSAETEASFKTVAFLSSKADEIGLKYILVTEAAGTRLADTVIANTKEKNQEILVLDSMQSVSDSEIGNGTSYLKIMAENLDIIKKALD